MQVTTHIVTIADYLTTTPDHLGSPYEFRLQPSDEYQRWGVMGTSKDVKLNMAVIQEMSTHYHRYEWAPKDPKRYLEQTCKSNVREWMLAPDVRSMAIAFGSHRTMNRLPHPTKCMVEKIAKDKARTADERSMIDEREADDLTKTVLILHREAVFTLVVGEIRAKQVAVPKLTFSICPEEDLKRWCYLLYKCLGFNLGTSLTRLQGWFPTRKERDSTKDRPQPGSDLKPSNPRRSRGKNKTKPGEQTQSLIMYCNSIQAAVVVQVVVVEST